MRSHDVADRTPASSRGPAGDHAVPVGPAGASVPLIPSAPCARVAQLVEGRPRSRARCRSALRRSCGCQPTGESTIPVTFPSASTSAPPADAGPDAASRLEEPARRRAGSERDEAVGRRDDAVAHPGRRSTGARRRAHRPHGVAGSRRRAAPMLRPRIPESSRSNTRSLDRVAPDDRRRVHDTIGGGHVDVVGRSDEPIAREDLRGARRDAAGTTDTHPGAAPRARLVVDADGDHRTTDPDRDCGRAHDGCAHDGRARRHRHGWPVLSDDCPMAPTALSTPSVRIAPAAPATSVAVHIGPMACRRLGRESRPAARARSGASRGDRAGRGPRGAGRIVGPLRGSRRGTPRRARRRRNPSRSSVTTHFADTTAAEVAGFPSPGGIGTRSVHCSPCSRPRKTRATGWRSPTTRCRSTR